jgi:hypothetical protein
LPPTHVAAAARCALPAQVSGFPTLKFVKDGVHDLYSGGRTTKPIVKYVRMRAGANPATALASEEAAAAFVGAAPVAVVGAFADAAAPAARAFMEASAAACVCVRCC